MILLSEGRYRETEQALLHLLPLVEKVQGLEHPHTLATLFTITLAILDQGRAGEAEDLFRDILPLHEKVKGKEHSNTLVTHANLARAILEQGRAGEAEALFRDILPLEEKVQGKEHPHTLATRMELARAALEAGAPERARAALAPVREDGGYILPHLNGQAALLRGWIADCDGDATEANSWLVRAEAYLAEFTPEHVVRQELARYRETRGAGRAGGTTLWMIAR